MTSFNKSDAATLEILQSAIALHRAGNLAQAEERYRNVLRRSPRQADANHNLGLLLRQTARTAQALPCFDIAVSARPGNAQFLISYSSALLEFGDALKAAQILDAAFARGTDSAALRCNRGNAARALNQPDEAEQQFRTALAQQPDDALAHYNLANLMQSRGRFDEAATGYRAALTNVPQFEEARHNLADVLNDLGNAAMSRGRIADAETSYREALQYKPDSPEGHYNLGNLLQNQERLEEAVSHYEKALALQPDLAEAHNSLGNAQRSLWQADAAIASYRRAIELRPDYAEAWSNLAPAIQYLDASEAEACCRKALALNPDLPEALVFLADAHANRGEFKEAERLLRRATTVAPEVPSAWAGLVNLRKQTPEDGAWLDHALKLAAQPIPVRQETYLQFAIGKYLDDVAQYDAAFAHYHRANELMKLCRPPYDAAREEALTARLCREITRDFMDAQSGIVSDKPVFIVGMPRSGTSLLEQILAAHPQIFGAGELPFWTQALAGNNINLKEQAGRYLAQLDAIGGNATRVVDKMPGNFRYVGLIHAALPDARFIHLKRNPVDTCLSIYFQYFNEIHSYANDLSDLEHYYKLYRRITAHWHAILPPDRLIEVAYEDLVENPEYWSKAIIEFLGLPWDARCLDYQQNTRTIGTASNWQARQAIGRHSVERWRRYAAHVVPLLQLRDELLDAETLHRQALSLHQSGDDNQAISVMRQAVALAPGRADWESDLGGLLNRVGNLDQAVAHFEAALQLDPSNAQAHYNLGCTLQAQNRLAQAEACYRRALELVPGNVDYLCNLSACLQLSGQLDAAIACSREALALDANNVKVLNNLGTALQELGKLDEAIDYLRRAVEYDPSSAKNFVTLGAAHQERGELEQAANCHRRAIVLDPGLVEAHFALGVALHALCRTSEAVECYRHALAIDPDRCRSFDNYVMTQQFASGIDADALFAAHLAYGEQFETPLKKSWPRHRNERDPERRLKIGYVSGDFRSHAVAHFIEPILAWHDRSQVEVFCYANQKRDDAVTIRLRELSDHWCSCIALDDDELAHRIGEDGIDILVDLSGHTSHNRLLTFARKPAPLQITYIGYLSTSGLTAMDYRLTDRLAEPPGSERYYTEKLLYLPDSMWCFQAPVDSPEIAPSPALANGYLTFGSFNNVDKVDAASVELWSALLRKLPDARLLMLAPPDTRPHFLKLFAQGGIAASRLAFFGKMSPQEFRRNLQNVDLALDSYPVNGATTTCECLWQGVPVLSLAGPRFLSRNGLSILHAAQLPDFAVQSETELFNTAALLANNPVLLNSIRMGMREHLAKTALMDGQGFTGKLEAIYRTIWRRWCTGT